jgi:hypothetical protein
MKNFPHLDMNGKQSREDAGEPAPAAPLLPERMTRAIATIFFMLMTAAAIIFLAGVVAMAWKFLLAQIGL